MTSLLSLGTKSINAFNNLPIRNIDLVQGVARQHVCIGVETTYYVGQNFNKVNNLFHYHNIHNVMNANCETLLHLFHNLGVTSSQKLLCMIEVGIYTLYLPHRKELHHVMKLDIQQVNVMKMKFQYNKLNARYIIITTSTLDGFGLLS